MAGLYIHVPFCQRKCFYCDFYSITDLKLSDKFADTLISEIELWCGDIHEKKLDISSIFFGGGTPTTLSELSIRKISDSIRKNFNLAPTAEFTVECNPGTTDDKKLEILRKCGANRLSIGIQSFDNSELKFLQRIHTAEEAIETYKYARKCGFDNISIDLMFGLPGQSISAWERNIDKAISMAPEHISTYCLTYEEGTPLHDSFSKGLVRKISEEQEAEMFSMVIDKLTGAGYNHYEVSNFALPGNECRHNLNYWMSGEYISFGPAAHGFLDGTRYWNTDNLATYTKLINSGQKAVAGSELLTRSDRIKERIMLELRASGLRVGKFNNDFGPAILTKASELTERLIEEGFLVETTELIRLTKKGYLFCDSVTQQFLDCIDDLLD